MNYYTYKGSVVKFTVSNVRDLVLSGAFREPVDKQREDDTSGTNSGAFYTVRLVVNK